MAGEQMFLGIRLQLDATGVVTGAAMAGNSLDKVSTRINQTGRAFDRNASNMMSASLRIAGALGTVAMAANKAGNIVANGFIKPSYEEAKSFETEMSMLKFVTEGTAEEMAKLRGVAIQTGLATQFSPQEAASGIRMLKAAGLETNLALESLNATLDITTGSAGALGLKDAASATAAALLKFSGSGESAVEIMDNFAQSTRETNMQMGDLLAIVDSMRDAPLKLKLTAAQAFSLAGVMRSAGMNTRAAGMNVAMFGNRLVLAQTRISRYLRKAKISEEDLFDASYFDDKMPNVAFHFKRLGVHLFETNGQMKDATKLLMELTDRARTLEGQSQKAFVETIGTILGPRSSAVLLALMNFKKGSLQGSAAFEKLVASVSSMPGAAREAAASIEETTAGMEKFIEGSVKTIQNIQGTVFLPIVKKYHLMLRKLLNTVLAFLEKNPAFTKALGYTAVAFYVLSKVLAVLAGGLAIAVAWAFLIGPALASSGAAAGILVAGLVVLKFVLIAIAIVVAAVVSIFIAFRVSIYLWRRVWDDKASGIFASIQIFFNSIRLSWKGLISLLKTGELSEALYKELDAAGLIGFVIALYQVKTRLKEIWKGIKEGFTEGMRPLLWGLDKIGRAVGFVIDIFSRLMTKFTGSDLTESASRWRALGYAIGIVSAIIVTGMVIAALALVIPMALITAAVVGFGYALYWVYEQAVLFSEWLEDLQVTATASLLGLWDTFKTWGGKIGDIFVESFKGNFEPFFAYLENYFDLTKKVLGWVTGDTTGAEVKAAAAKIGLGGPTDEEQQLNESRATDYYARQDSDSKSDWDSTPSRVSSRVVPRAGSYSAQYSALLQALQNQGRTVHVEKIELATEGKSPQEALRLAKKVMEEVAKINDAEAEVEFI